MGLDAFKSDDSYSQGSVSSRKKIKNLSLTKQSWEFLLSNCARPIPAYEYSYYSESELKCLIQFIDEQLEQDAPFGLTETSSHLDKIKDFREDLVEELKSR